MQVLIIYIVAWLPSHNLKIAITWKGNAMNLRKEFSEYYKEWFSRWNASSLVEQEQVLSDLIDSELFMDFILNDEVILLYDLIRDECVRRLAYSVRTEEQ